jgi:hypothetical protein
MKKLFFLIFIFFSSATWAESLKEILQNPSLFDNKKVVLAGEVIGEPLKAKEGLWLNISTKGVNIGVYLEDPSSVEKIENFGSYKNRGDIVRVEGIFHKSCPSHFERDIHAQIVEVVELGYIREEQIPPFKRNLSGALAIICLILATIYFIKMKYGK